MIDLNKLRHAVAVAQAGAFSTAADEIHISQSALSRSIQILEKTYAVRMFERGKSGVRLTLEGARFIKIAEESLRRAQAMHDELARVVADEPPQIAFGMGPMTAETLLPLLIPRLKEDKIRYRIKIQSNSALTLMLRQGEIDFFVGGLRKGSEFHAIANQFSVQPIARASMNLLVRKDHPLLSEDLTPENMSRYPTAAGSFVREIFGLATILRFGLQEPSMEVDDYGLLLSLAASSDYILICNDMLFKSRPGLRLAPLALTLDIESHSEWAIVSATESQMSAPIRRAKSLIVDIVDQLARDVM